MQQLDSLDAVHTWLADPQRGPAAVQSLDLSDVHHHLTTQHFPGCLFLGCHLPNGLAAHLVNTGATVIGHFPERLFHVHRSRLYTADELFDGFEADDPDAFLHTLDHRIYEEYLDDGGPEPVSIAVSLARRLHDHSITDEIAQLVRGRRVVAFMGGHGLERSDPFYGDIAHMARALTREGWLVASGGGPGAMEATHLGAWFAGREEQQLQEALEGPFVRRPAGAPKGKEYADADWLHRAMALRDAYPASDEVQRRYPSLGIPTWLYGHEPPAVFATHIGKYFANSVREDGLLALAKHGVVFAPGSAGTIQEIFQDVTQNHYGTLGVSSPMVLFGRDYWTETKPVWPLLSKLSEGRPWGDLVHLVDARDEALQILRDYEPLLHLSGSPDRRLQARIRKQLRLRGNVRFVVQAESVASVARDLGEDDAIRTAVLRLVERLQFRAMKELTEDVAVSIATAAVERDGAILSSWLVDSLGDDWVSPTKAAALGEVLRQDPEGPVFLRLPDVPVRQLGWGGVPSKGLLVVRWGRKLSVWVAALDD